MRRWTVRQKIEESNRIEGILRPPTPAEIEAHNLLVATSWVEVRDLEHFVSVYQPGAMLRDRPGMDVRVGGHFPPRGGPGIRALLEVLLEEIREEAIAPWDAHLRYETLHPFMDGNGRSGRALWYWMMEHWDVSGMAGLGFLHAFYYQTLQNAGRLLPSEEFAGDHCIDAMTRARNLLSGKEPDGCECGALLRPIIQDLDIAIRLRRAVDLPDSASSPQSPE